MSHRRRMNPVIYRSAMSGDWETIKGLCTDFHTQKTPNGNTILHVLAELSDSFAYAVTQIAEQEPNLVYKKNQEGETPLVIASRKGHYNFVRALIDSATSTSLFSGNKNAQTRAFQHLGCLTAVLEALRNNKHEVAKLLFDKDAIRDIAFPSTSIGILLHIIVQRPRNNLLYLAVEKGYDDIVALILSKYPFMIACRGPLGRNPLHAAALSNSQGCMKLILQRFSFIRGFDIVGWSAVHYASMLNHTESVKLLLSANSSSGYLRAWVGTDHGMTALHIAVFWGHIDVVREILFHCPDCWEMITLSKRKNILHLAVENERQEVLEFILETSWGPGLINKKDGDGNTPLHLYVSTKNLDGHKLVNHPCTNKDEMNNDLLTPLDIIQGAGAGTDVATERQTLIRDKLINAGATPQLRRPFYHPNIKNAIPSGGKPENMEPYIVVATLIVTVTFAAGFTIPGGFDNKEGKEGMAVLSKHAAFIAFVVSNSLAMMFSVVAMLLHLLYVIPNKWFVTKPNPAAVAFCIALSLLLMLIVFVTGIYVVLPMQALKIYLIVVGSLFGLPILSYFFLSCISVVARLGARLKAPSRPKAEGIEKTLVNRLIFSYLKN